MEGIDDPDIAGKSPMGFIKNFMLKRLDDFQKSVIYT